jgi:hypothetical protein
MSADQQQQQYQQNGEGPTEEEIEAFYRQQQQQDSLQIADVVGYLAGQFMSKATENPIQRVLLISTVANELRRLGLEGDATGVIALVKSLYKREGLVRGMFRGLLTDTAFGVPSFINTILAESITGPIIGALAPLVVDPNNFGPTTELILTLWQQTSMSLLTIPVVGLRETVMTHLHADMKKDKGTPYRFSGPIDCITRIYRSNGIKGFYQGCLLGTVSALVYRTSFYATFLGFSMVMPQEALMQIQLPLAFVATLGCGLLTHPFEVVRRRMMLAVPVAPPATKKQEDNTTTTDEAPVVVARKYNGVADCVKSIIDDHGVAGLFDGMSVRVAISCSMLVFRMFAQ